MLFLPEKFWISSKEHLKKDTDAAWERIFWRNLLISNTLREIVTLKLRGATKKITHSSSTLEEAGALGGDGHFEVA